LLLMSLTPLLWLIARTVRGGEAKPNLLTHLLMAPATGAQIYFWGLWAAYCAALVVSRTALPEVTHKSLYYLVAVLSLLAPLGYMMSQEQIGASQREAQRIASGTMLYSSIVIAAFGVFVFWPGLMRVPYGWASVVLAPIQDPTQRVLEEKYFAELDAWVARGPMFRAGEKEDAVAIKARVQPLVQTCGKLMMATATPQQRAAFLTTERHEWDFRVDVCTKMTVNRLHEQPEFQKPELVQAICNSTIPVFGRLCVRSGLRR